MIVLSKVYRLKFNVLELYAVVNVLSIQFSKVRGRAVLYWVGARLPGPLRHGYRSSLPRTPGRLRWSHCVILHSLGLSVPLYRPSFLWGGRSG